MLVPLSWLEKYVDITVPTKELCERLTLAGLEVEGVNKVGDWWDPDLIVVGHIQAIHPHPDADRLVLVDVDYGGDEPERVVTGAPNLAVYRDSAANGETLPVLKAPFARSGAVLFDGHSDKVPRPKKKLKPSKIRGIKSSGMVCSELELGISESHEGILLLPEDAPVGTPLRDYLGAEIVEIDLTPDMARCLNMIGTAREVSALTGAALHLPADECETSGDDHVSEYVNVQIDDPDLCNRYTAMLIKDVTIGESPKWMQDVLTQAGMRPINNIVDITNYVMLEWGQPLHAFDYDILKERAARATGDNLDETPTIIVKRAEPDEKFTTLDDIERNMDDTMLMITDTAGSVAIGGVMGGLESEVTDSTTNVLLEAATFEGINNRRTAQKLRMSSEANYRFARSIPATLNPIGARRAAELMRLYAGGRVVSGIVDTYPVPQEVRKVYTTVSDARRILGMEVTLDGMRDALLRLDFEVEEVSEIAADATPESTFALHRLKDETLLLCTAPWHRLDVRIPADIIEEVARIIGYEHVGMTLIDDVLPTQRRNVLQESEEAIRDILVSSGLQEIINHPLTTRENHGKLLVGEPAETGGRHIMGEFIALTNPSVEDRYAMRRSMLVSALENLARNLRYSNRLTTFEVGRVYFPEEKADDAAQEGRTGLPHEDRRLSLLMAGPQAASNYYNQNSDVPEMDFFDLKGVVEMLIAQLGFDTSILQFKASPETQTFGPRCAEVWLGEENLGLMGEIHPQVRNAFDLPSIRVNAAELRIEPLVKPSWNLMPMQSISNYPPVVEDLSFEVSEAVTVRMVEEIMRGSGGKILADVELVDIYRGEQIDANSKSLSYRLTYQSIDHSLSEKEVTKTRKKIIRQVEHQTKGKLRG
ncbi:MAG: phenylalanine--tRNA ligase subunit beta [Chloroflexota bacterium]